MLLSHLGHRLCDSGIHASLLWADSHARITRNIPEEAAWAIPYHSCHVSRGTHDEITHQNSSNTSQILRISWP